MADEQAFLAVEIARGYLMQYVTDLSDEQLLEVPDGAKNNVLWNIGHVVFSHAGLTYGPAGLTSPVPESYEALFKGGTSPSDWSETPPIDEVKGLLESSTAQTKEDYLAGKFDGFKSMDLMPGVTLATVEQAFGFNGIHEGVHLGFIMLV